MIATVTLNPSLDEWIELPALQLGRLNRAQQFQRYPGGKGINVSRVVHTLGRPTVAYAIAGGEDGAILQRLLTEAGITCQFVQVTGSTRNNYKFLTRRPRVLTEVNTAGPRVPPAALHTLMRRVWARRPRAVALSGSLPPGAPTDIYARWIRTLRPRRVPVVLDTSGEALRRGLAARPWLIKPNQHEAEELLGRSLATLGAVVRGSLELTRRGCAWVLLSRGGDGAILASADPPSVWQAVPPAVRVNSAVGAGDSLVAGWLVGWLARRGGTPGTRSWEARVVHALRLGIACGAAAAVTSGTELCRRTSVRRLLPRVRIERLA